MTQWKKSILFLVLILIVTIAAGIFIMPPAGTPFYKNVKTPNLILNNYRPWRLGLDLVGGSALLYDIDLANIPAEDYQSVTAGLRDVVERRVNLFGVSEPKVAIVRAGDRYQLLVEIAGEKDLAKAAAQIGETPVLDFRINCAVQDETTIACDNTKLTGRHIKSANLELNELQKPIVSLVLDDEGTKIFSDLTEQNIGKYIAVFLDNELVSAPMVQEKIPNGQAAISGMSFEEAEKLVERFNAGALAAPIKLTTQRTVNATAANDSLQRIIYAGIVGILLVMTFMLVLYKAWGLAASISLLVYTIWCLAIFKFVPGFAMSIAAITGFLLSIGEAVDANILIFERAREEIKSGANRKVALESGYKHAWTSIRDGNLCTILTSLALYFFTTSFVKGFALTLMIGTAVSLLSAVGITKVILRSTQKD
jgi:protein-export membrane protein SecD